MTKIYAVTAVVTLAGRSRQVPTFYLNADVQGIVDADHARRIAEDVIDPLGLVLIAGLTVVDVSGS